jgi:hypothetical protein
LDNVIAVFHGFNVPLSLESFGAGIEFFNINQSPWPSAFSGFVTSAVMPQKAVSDILTLAGIELVFGFGIKDIEVKHNLPDNKKGQPLSRTVL